jgi:hypothetical protein
MRTFLLILGFGIAAGILYLVAKGKGATLSVTPGPSPASVAAAGNSAAGIIQASSQAVSSLAGAFNVPTTDGGFNGN